MKIAFVGTEPEKDTRLLKLIYSLDKIGVELAPVLPVYRSRRGGRILSGILRYAIYMTQLLFSNHSIYWLANAPDIVALPLILARKKYIYDFRSVWSKELAVELGNPLFTAIAEKIEKLAMSNAAGIILNTDTLEKDASPYNKPLFSIYNYPTEQFKPTVDRSTFRKSRKVDNSVKIILFVGRISKVEGADLFGNILEDISKLDNTVFWVVGDGPLMYHLQALQKHYPEKLVLFGWVDYRDVPNYINASDICVVPRHKNLTSDYFNENGLLKLSEYILFKKPVVCSGLARSKSYLLVEENKLGKGIIEALNGKAPIPEPKTWEKDVIPEIKRLISEIPSL